MDGYDVVLHTFRRVDLADALASEVSDLGRKAVVVRAHLGRPGATDRLATEVVEEVGPIDAVVAAAASGVMRPMTELTEHHLRWTFDVTATPIAPLLVALRPRAAVALSSMGSHQVVPSYGAVGAAKAAMETFVRYLAVELAPTTRVNTLSVGLVRTRSARLLADWERRAAEIEARTPMGRLVTKDDVAAAVAWLVSEESSMITGATIELDGGRHLAF